MWQLLTWEMTKEILCAHKKPLSPHPHCKKRARLIPGPHSVTFPPSPLVTFQPRNGANDKEKHKNLQQHKYMLRIARND